MSAYPSIEELESEHQKLIFSQFTAEDAWSLGCKLRERALEHPTLSPVAVRIYHSNGQILFSAFTRSGTNADSESWLKRKAASVFRWGTSSLHLGTRIRAKGLKGNLVSESLVVDDNEYACHGGGFPIRVRGVEGVVGAVIVSGLSEVDDHKIAVGVITEYLSN